MFPYQELINALKLDIAAHTSTPLDILSSDKSIKEIRCIALHTSFYKKLAPNGVTAPSATEEALKKFLRMNAEIATGPFEFPVDSEHDSIFWDYFRDIFMKALLPDDVDFDLGFIRETFAAGPGASLGCDNDSFYTKLFASRISVTSPYLLALYRGAISESDAWALAEKQRDQEFGHEIVSGNRLFFVPKTAEVLRTCCTEPMVNMLIQKSIGSFLERCLAKSFGISLSTQPDNNRELARLGSIDGSFGTIDLQSASDSISWSLVQRICPSNLLGYFKHARSPRTTLPDGSEIDLNMISTMGNGFTFPLQTLIFASAVRAVYQMMNLDSHCPKTQFGVFGDDIVVNKEAYGFLVRCLTRLGFKVNTEKSFNSGPFRESCGHDWYNGYFVRGVYIRSLETASDVYSAINRLNRWSALAGVRLPNTISKLRGFVRLLLVPFSESIDCGIQVPFKLTLPSVDNRYWFAYRKLVKESRKRQVPVSLEVSRQLGYRAFNTHGWEVAYLGGFARSEEQPFKSEKDVPREGHSFKVPRAFMTLRSLDGAVRTKVIRGSIPFWDWLGSEHRPEAEPADMQADFRSSFSFAAWERSVAGNR